MKKVAMILLAALLLVLTSCATQTDQLPDLPIAGVTEKPTAAPVMTEWPKELDSLPAFADYESFEYAGQTTNGWEIALTCTLEQLEAWRGLVNEKEGVYGEFSVFHNGEYVVQVHESYAQSAEDGLLRVTMYLTKIKPISWPQEMAHLPAYNGHGAATVELSVDTAYIENWSILEFTLYGETQATLEEYLNLLVSEGYEEKQGEDGTYYLRLRGEEADQFAYEFSEDAVVTVTWVTCPAADLMAE